MSQRGRGGVSARLRAHSRICRWRTTSTPTWRSKPAAPSRAMKRLLGRLQTRANAPICSPGWRRPAATSACSTPRSLPTIARPGPIPAIATSVAHSVFHARAGPAGDRGRTPISRPTSRSPCSSPCARTHEAPRVVRGGQGASGRAPACRADDPDVRGDARRPAGGGPARAGRADRVSRASATRKAGSNWAPGRRLARRFRVPPSAC